MATLERKPKAAIPPAVSPPVAEAPASAPLPTPSADWERPKTSAPTSPAPAKAAPLDRYKGDDEIKAAAAEERLVEFLRRPESLEVVKQANPKIAQAALDAAVTYVTNRNEPASWVGVVNSTPQSVLNAVTKLAASGLTVSHLSGEAFLVPRWDKSLSRNIVTPVPGVRGLEKKIFESGKIASVDGNVVRAQDHFEANEGLNATLVFKRNLRPDPTKPNPVVGAYVVITSTENRPAKIKTTAIEERTAGEGTTMEKKVWSIGGKDLNTGRMNLDSAAVYAVQRPAMREVIRTWLHDNTELNNLAELEDNSYKAGEEIAGAQPRITIDRPKRTNQPSVVESNVAGAPAAVPQVNPVASVTVATVDPVAKAVEHAKEAVPAAPEENLRTAMRRAEGVRLI